MAPDTTPLALPAKKVPVLRRFWKTVGIQEHPEHFAITLDHRALKTPEGNPLIIPAPKRVLATLLANEWESQDKVIKHHALPLTSLVSKVIDGLSESGARMDLCLDLLRYLNTDTICFQEEYPSQLVKLQTEHWDPLLDWARTEFGVEIRTFDSVLLNSQPEHTRNTFRSVLQDMDQWTLAGMERAVYYSKSFIIALALVKGRLTAEQASLAAQVEVQSQINRWGEVEDTHDVDHRDIRRQLGSVAIVVANV